MCIIIATNPHSPGPQDRRPWLHLLKAEVASLMAGDWRRASTEATCRGRQGGNQTVLPWQCKTTQHSFSVQVSFGTQKKSIEETPKEIHAPKGNLRLPERDWNYNLPQKPTSSSETNARFYPFPCPKQQVQNLVLKSISINDHHMLNGQTKSHHQCPQPCNGLDS